MCEYDVVKLELHIIKYSSINNIEAMMVKKILWTQTDYDH